jgi:hypothetical protein
MMPDYIISELELLNPERLRQCSSVIPDYIIRDLELVYPERLRECSSVKSRASETVQQLYA